MSAPVLDSQRFDGGNQIARRMLAFWQHNSSVAGGITKVDDASKLHAVTNPGGSLAEFQSLSVLIKSEPALLFCFHAFSSANLLSIRSKTLLAMRNSDQFRDHRFRASSIKPVSPTFHQNAFDIVATILPCSIKNGHRRPFQPDSTASASTVCFGQIGKILRVFRKRAENFHAGFM